MEHTHLCVLILLIIAIPTYTLIVPFTPLFPARAVDSAPNVWRQAGNADAAADLYGIGIHLGAYFQILGMLLSCVQGSKAGIKLISSGVSISLLLSWTWLVIRKYISPCEAWLVLTLVYAYGAVRSCALVETPVGGGVAISLATISSLWQSVSFLWFFATIVRELPILGTQNRVWFFSSVDVAGRLRRFMLFYSALSCLIGFSRNLVLDLDSMEMTFGAWAKGGQKKESGEESIIKLPRLSEKWRELIEKIATDWEEWQQNVVFNTARAMNEWFFERILFRIKSEMPEGVVEMRRKRGIK